MKKNIFYLLWVAYALVVVFILSINKVFTGGVERTKMDSLNLALNLCFLLLIGVLFAVSTISFINLNRVTSSLSRVSHIISKEANDSGEDNTKAIWEKMNNAKSLFNNQYLDKAMAEYKTQIKRNGNNFASVRYVSIEDFINEALLEKAGMSFFNSAMPGTLTGLGILGTFIGLSLGLASFSGDDIYTISDNVGPLLSGMKVAFHTSVYGIFFSLIYTFIYRSVMSDAYEKLDKFLNAFKHFTSAGVKESEATTAMLVYQANTTSLLKEILDYMRGTHYEQTESLDVIVNRFCDKMTYTLNEDYQALGNSIRAAREAQAGSVEVFNTLTATTAELVETNRQIVNSIDAISKKQHDLEMRLLRQDKRIDDTCDQIQATLYSFGLAKNVEEDYEV